MKILHAIFPLTLLVLSAGAQNITGTIVISKKLTRHSVTAAVPLYQRGPTAKLAQDEETDPLAAERSHVILYLEGPGPAAVEASAHTGPFVMKQLDRQFFPDLLVVPLGATVNFPNQDPIFHNVFSLSHPRAFDLGSYDKGDSRSVTFTKPGIVSLYCHLHPNMAATVLVAPNRWYARSDRAGHFHISDVPPGRYTVVAWHKAAGTFRQNVIVEPGQDVSTTFVLPFAETQTQPTSTKQLALNSGDRQ